MKEHFLYLYINVRPLFIMFWKSTVCLEVHSDVRTFMLERESIIYPHKKFQLVQSKCCKIRYLSLFQHVEQYKHVLYPIWFEYVHLLLWIAVLKIQDSCPWVSLHPRHSASGLLRHSAFAVRSCLAELASFPLLYIVFLCVQRGVNSSISHYPPYLTLGVTTDWTSQALWAWYTHLENRRRKEGRQRRVGELMMPTLRDSTMSHPGENSHQVRVKAYYKG